MSGASLRDLLRSGARWGVRHVGSHALILVYHRVAALDSDPWNIAVSPAHFAEQMAVLRRHYRPVGLRELVDSVTRGRVVHGSVAVTFDDGYLDNLEQALPILQAHDVPATMFLTAGTLGQTTEFWWDELERLLLGPKTLPSELRVAVHGTGQGGGQGAGQASGVASEHCWDLRGAESLTEVGRHADWQAWTAPPGPRQKAYQELWHLLLPLSDRERACILGSIQAWAGAGPIGRVSHRTMTPSQARQLAAGRGIEIGAHSMTHAQLASLDVEGQRWEIRQSRRVLEELTGQSITSFAYPFGGEAHFTEDTVRILREEGFERAVINVSRLTSRRSDPFRLPRLHVTDLGGDEFQRLLSSWLPAYGLRSFWRPERAFGRTTVS